MKDENDTWISNPIALQSLARDHFIKLFTAPPSDTNVSFSLPFFPPVPPDIFAHWRSGILDEEVKGAIFQMGAFKAPSLEGLPPGFYQNNWDIIGGDLCNMVREAFALGKLPNTPNPTLKRLIPKVDDPEIVADFRPISLFNVSIKVITKITVNRLRPYLDDIISPNQSSFLPGRGTQNNILAVQEIIHSM